MQTNSCRKKGRLPFAPPLQQPFITEQTAEEEDGNARQRLEKGLLHRILRMQVEKHYLIIINEVHSV
jgi:hypothetical protein